MGNLTVAEWISILDAYEWSCAYCRGAFESMDHVESIADGGGTVKGNVLPSCIVCNGAWNEADNLWPFMIAAYVKALELTLEMGGVAGVLR